jgi:hypothetical protein
VLQASPQPLSVPKSLPRAPSLRLELPTPSSRELASLRLDASGRRPTMPEPRGLAEELNDLRAAHADLQVGQGSRCGVGGWMGVGGCGCGMRVGGWVGG